MSLIDKVTGKVKQVAGDLAGDEDLRREGRLEERKGEAKEQLAREEDAIERERARAEDEKLRADARAEERVAAQDERAQRKAEEIADLERRTA
jgi:uncharacterized protein YjbJ (UPF0337 family)